MFAAGVRYCGWFREDTPHWMGEFRYLAPSVEAGTRWLGEVDSGRRRGVGRVTHSDGSSALVHATEDDNIPSPYPPSLHRARNDAFLNDDAGQWVREGH